MLLSLEGGLDIFVDIVTNKFVAIPGRCVLSYWWYITIRFILWEDILLMFIELNAPIIYKCQLSTYPPYYYYTICALQLDLELSHYNTHQQFIQIVVHICLIHFSITFTLLLIDRLVFLFINTRDRAPRWGYVITIVITFTFIL